MKATFKLICSCAAVLLLQVSAQAQFAERRIALVMGVSDYNAGGRLSPLPGIDIDVQTITTAVKSAGFEVTVVMNPTLSQAEDAVTEFGTKIKEANESGRAVGLFYFSGHGGEVDGKNYLLPASARIDSPRDAKDKGLPVNIVLNRMAESGGQVNLLFLDCCRTDMSKKGSDQGLAGMQAKGVFIGFATADGRESLGTAKGSPYTLSLAKYMSQKGISVMDMHTFVTSEVKATSKNLGMEQNPFQYSGLDRVFQMVPGEREVAQNGELARRDQELEQLKQKYEAEMAALKSRMATPDTPPPAPTPSYSTPTPSYSPWVFPDSSSRYLTSSDLQYLSADQLWLARNEIYARHGYIFTTPRGRSYTSSLGSQYYQGVSSSQPSVEASFNAYEKANVMKIKSYESR